MDWPSAIIEEIASRRCIFFLGSGVSAGSLSNDGVTRPPTWKEFLENLSDTISNVTIKEDVSAMIQEKKYLEAAEIIRTKGNAADFAEKVRGILVSPKFEASELHKIISALDPKIVITTNYDDIYERYCNSGDGKEYYNVCKYYEDHLVNDLRSPTRQIVKIHGCVQDPSKIVLSKSDYFSQRQKYANFNNVIGSLMLTSTLLFIGYSINDPDIQILLENANIAFKSDHPHYAIIPNDHDEYSINFIKNSYNIFALKYSAGDYTELIDSFNDLNKDVQTRRKNNPST